MKHPWMQGEILPLPRNEIPVDMVDDYSSVLVQGINTHVLTFDKYGGPNEIGLYTLHKLSKPIIREYLVAVEAGFEFGHPGLQMLYDTGCVRHSWYWRENKGLWLRGEYGS